MWLSNSILVLGMFLPASLLAQDVVISGKDFESGAGDAKLAEIARQAAASGKTVIVTTPPYWQDKAAAKLRATSPDVHVKTSDAFFENVIVRVVGTDKPEKPTKAPEPAPVAKPVEAPPTVIAKAAPRAEPKPVAPPAPAIKAPPPEPEQKAAVAAAAPAARVESAPVVMTVASTARPAAAVPPPPVAVAPTSAPAASAPAPVVASIAPPASAAAPTVQQPTDTAELRRKFESQLNLGKSAEGSIKPSQLQKGDEIFIKGPLRAVVRRFGSRVQLFWLEGALNVERAELSMKDPSHFTVNESLRDVANPSLRAMHLEPKMFAAVVPAEKSPVRTDMERHFNDSHAIVESLHPDQLQYGDLFYIYRTYGVVFRRTDQGFFHYWLDGSVDLNQAGIVHDGDAYRLVSDRL